MKYIYPISLILLSSYQLCFSNTISVGNATYTVPEDWTTVFSLTENVRVSDSSDSRYFEIGTGYPFRADGYLEEEYRYIQDTSGFENGSIQGFESEFVISSKLDMDMYGAIIGRNLWNRFNSPSAQIIFLTPVSIKLLAGGAYERTYNYKLTYYHTLSQGDHQQVNMLIGTIGIIIDADSISHYIEVEVRPDNNSLTPEETSTLYNIL